MPGRAARAWRTPGVDLVEAVEADTGVSLRTLRVDGGMTANPVFVQALADAVRPAGRGVAGAGGDRRRAPASSPGSGVGLVPTLDEVAATWRPARVVEPTWSDDRRGEHRARWRARARAERGPELRLGYSRAGDPALDSQ